MTDSNSDFRRAPDAIVRIQAQLAILTDAELNDFAREQVRSLHAVLLEAKRKSTPYMQNLGRTLILKNGKLRYGGFVPWIESIGLNPRSARAYMQIARQPLRQLEKENSSAAVLSARAILATISKPQPSKAEARSRPRGLPSPALAHGRVTELMMLLSDTFAGLDADEFDELVLPEVERIVTAARKRRDVRSYGSPEDGSRPGAEQ
jgi:hypothetical protein